MIDHEFLKEKGVLIVNPKGPLEENDFEKLTRIIDPFIAERKGLRGLMIYTKYFPGWTSFAALLRHLRFIKDHHRAIGKVAAVSDSRLWSILPLVAGHFVQPEVRHFNYDDRKNALYWLCGDNTTTNSAS